MIGWYFISLRERQKVQQMVWRQMAITLEVGKVRFLPCMKHQCFALTASPSLSCFWGPAYLEFFVEIKEALQEKYHVWYHGGQVSGVRIGLVHITESGAHGVIHKQEAGRLELHATPGKSDVAISQPVPNHLLIIFCELNKSHTCEDISVVMVCY